MTDLAPERLSFHARHRGESAGSLIALYGPRLPEITEYAMTGTKGPHKGSLASLEARLARTEDVVGMTMQQLLGPLYEKNAPYIDAAFNGEKQVFEREIPLPTGKGSRHSLATYTPHIVDGRVLGIFVHVADVTQLKRLELQLQQAKEHAESLAAHDVLTGLPNRALFTDRVVHARQRRLRPRRIHLQVQALAAGAGRSEGWERQARWCHSLGEHPPRMWLVPWLAC